METVRQMEAISVTDVTISAPPDITGAQSLARIIETRKVLAAAGTKSGHTTLGHYARAASHTPFPRRGGRLGWGRVQATYGQALHPSPEMFNSGQLLGLELSC